MAKTTRYHGADAVRLAEASLALLVLISLAPEASAQCVQSGNDVQCKGTDPDGFESIINGITLTVQPGATVQNNGIDPAIGLQNDSEATVEQGGSGR